MTHLQTGSQIPSIIPRPADCRPAGGAPFVFTASTVILSDPASAGVATWLSRLLGLQSNGGGAAAVTLAVDPACLQEVGEEGYRLSSSARGVTIRGATAAGVFRGVQTLRQLLPPECERGSPPDGVAWPIPALEIVDRTRFSWRGLLFDVGRYFYTVDEVKKLLDSMALLKLNVLHWHLTDDQGWRIEIKKYPRLVEVGGWRAESPRRGDRTRGDRLRYGGFYTQEQIKDVVAYAAQRFITVVPEIDLPGHCASALAAYPELGNSDVPGYAPRVQTSWGIKPYTYAPKEETFAFLEDVLTEVASLFPSHYVHIGGDEAPKIQWQQSAFAQDFMRRNGLENEDQLQSYFIARIGRILRAKNRKLIGWDEIQEGGTPEGASVMVWRTHASNWQTPGPKPPPNWTHLLSALKDGSEVVITPASNFYLDFNQADPKNSPEPEAYGGLTTLEQVYTFEPVPAELTAEQRKLVLGVEGAIWTECIWDFPKVEYMAFPRACAVAEIAWSPLSQRDFGDFERRLGPFLARLDELGVHYRRPGVDSRTTIQ